MQNGKKVLTLHDMSKKMCSFFLPLIWSIFLPLASVDRHRRRRRSLFLPLFLVVFRLNGVECLSPSPPLAFGGVDLVAQGEASIPVWVLIHFAGFVFLVFCRWVVWISVWYRCELWVWVGGYVGKEMNILFE